MNRAPKEMSAWSSTERVPQGMTHEDFLGFIPSFLEMTRMMACRGWFVMSGATVHACSNRYSFKDYRAIKGRIMLLDGTKKSVVGIGTVELKVSTGCSLTLKDVIHVPGIIKDVISLSKLNIDGFTILFASTHSWRMFRHQNSVRFHTVGTVVGGLHRLTLWRETQEIIEISDDESVGDSNSI